MPLDDMRKADGLAYDFFLRVLVIVSGVAPLLSTAGVYSLMSFTLSHRTREIGIRVTLGAAAHGIIRAIFSRAFGQIGLGILTGRRSRSCCARARARASHETFDRVTSAINPS